MVEKDLKELGTKPEEKEDEKPEKPSLMTAEEEDELAELMADD